MNMSPVVHVTGKIDRSIVAAVLLALLMAINFVRKLTVTHSHDARTQSNPSAVSFNQMKFSQPLSVI